MALDLSYESIFGKTQFSSFQIGTRHVYDECSDKVMNDVGDCWNFNFDLWNSHDEKTEKGSDDIVDLLPSDPFGMDMSATFTAITGWIQEFEKDLFELRTLGFVMDENEGKTGDDRIFSGLNVVWNGAMTFYPEVPDAKPDGILAGSAIDKELCLCDKSLLSDGTELLGKYRVSESSVTDCPGCTEESNGINSGAPHDALFYALGHLGVKDLLSVERVCKSLRDAVQNDPLLWRNIQIDRPLNDKISDDSLLNLTRRAQGCLQCLSLVECRKITDRGLKGVLETNPRLTKVCIHILITQIFFDIYFLFCFLFLDIFPYIVLCLHSLPLFRFICFLIDFPCIKCSY